MKFGDIDFKLTFNYFWDSPDRNKLILYWTLFGIIQTFGWIVLYIPILFFLLLGENGIILIALYSVCMVIFMMVFVYALWAFTQGSAIQMYKRLKYADLDKYVLTDNPFTKIYSKIVDGVKMIIVNIPYWIPVILLFLALVLFMAFMSLAFIQENEVIIVLGIMVFLFLLMLVTTIQFIYQFVLVFILKPLLYETISEKGYREALNFKGVYNKFMKDRKKYLTLGLALFVVNIAWGIAYFMTSLLIYVCIGIFLLPVIIGLYSIIKIYIEPHILAQSKS